MNYLRLKKQADFQKLFTKGRRAFSPSLTMIYFPSKETRMGISVGKRHGKSVKRNRIKRLLREAFRTVCPQLKGGYAFVLVPKQAQEYSFAAFSKSLKSALKKEGLLP